MTGTSTASKPSGEAAPPSSARSGPDAPNLGGERRTERLLALKLAGTAERRRAQQAEIEWLANAVDFDWLTAFLRVERLLPLLGTRLAEAAPSAVPAKFREAVVPSLAAARRRAALVEQVALRLIRELEAEGITVVPLKGPHLAERLHGDASLRLSKDIDLLVQPEDFHEAVRVLGRFRYTPKNQAPWIDGLPLFEASLLPGDNWHPPIDLHWRLHWYEESFSRSFIRRSEPGAYGMRAPQRLDELAALLLFWARDGLWGLRHGVDIAAWWDRHGEELQPSALDAVVEAHPALRRALAVAALFAERTVGLPADRLLSGLDRRSPRTRAALGLGNVVTPGSARQLEACTVLIDALVSPRGGAAALIGRHLVLPSEVIGEVYGLGQDARAQRTLRRAYYAAVVSAQLAGGAWEAVRARR